MPMLIRFIDAIAREKERDVLFVRFGNIDEQSQPVWTSCHDWENDQHRIDLIAWLDAQDIRWSPCGSFASENCMSSYQGDIYLDVPFDRTDPVYQELAHRLENPDETRKTPGVTFCYLPLVNAMRNSHHDEPGFWEKWAENF